MHEPHLSSWIIRLGNSDSTEPVVALFASSCIRSGANLVRATRSVGKLAIVRIKCTILFCSTGTRSIDRGNVVCHVLT